MYLRCVCLPSYATSKQKTMSCMEALVSWKQELRVKWPATCYKMPKKDNFHETPCINNPWYKRRRRRRRRWCCWRVFSAPFKVTGALRCMCIAQPSTLGDIKREAESRMETMKMRNIRASSLDFVMRTSVEPPKAAVHLLCNSKQ